MSTETLQLVQSFGSLGTVVLALYAMWRLGLIEFGKRPNGKPRAEDIKRTFNGSAHEVVQSVRELVVLVRELHKMHDQRDEDGVPIWWNRKATHDAIMLLAETARQLSLVLAEIQKSQERMESDIRRLARRST